MAGEAEDPKRGRPDSEFPGPHFPSIFADGALTHVNAGGISKFYLYRVDPNMFARGGIATTPSVQVNMPTNGFMNTVAFFYQRIQFLIETGVLTREEWDRAVLENEPASKPKVET